MSFTYEMPHGYQPTSEAELYSCPDRSYSEWQYGDEASLYSIAEDSREYGSDVFSIAGTDAVVDIPTHVVKSEGQWTGKEEEEEEEIGDSSNSAFRDLFRRLHHSSIMKFGLIGLLLLIAVLVILVAILVSNSGASTSPGSSEVGIEAPANAPVALPMDTPSLSPESSLTASFPTQKPSTQANIPSPTVSPTHSMSHKLASSFVTNALNSCVNADLLEDPTTPQGRIFQKLVLELFEQTTVDANGFIYYPLKFGDAFIKEKFALGMLYEATNGDEWDNNMNWETENDPCAGWNGVQNCRPRREGSCGIIEIDLGTFTADSWLPGIGLVRRSMTDVHCYLLLL